MLLVIDNYDSFTYNLVQYFGELGAQPRIFRNDEISVADIAALAPSRIVISPGPCTPKEAGISGQVILTYGTRIPVLGVCLGHQCIGDVFGGEVVPTASCMAKRLPSSTTELACSGTYQIPSKPRDTIRSSSKERPFPSASLSTLKRPKVRSWDCAINRSPFTESSSTQNRS